MEKHYNLNFLKDYYGDDVIAMSEILKLYLEETPKELWQIENYLTNNDAVSAKIVTHKIKTSIALLGMSDPVEFIAAMHHHSGAIEVSDALITMFRIFKEEVLKGLQDIEQDFFSVT